MTNDEKELLNFMMVTLEFKDWNDKFNEDNYFNLIHDEYISLFTPFIEKFTHDYPNHEVSYQNHHFSNGVIYGKNQYLNSIVNNAKILNANKTYTFFSYSFEVTINNNQSINIYALTVYKLIDHGFSINHGFKIVPLSREYTIDSNNFDSIIPDFESALEEGLKSIITDNNNKLSFRA